MICMRYGKAFLCSSPSTCLIIIATVLVDARTLINVFVTFPLSPFCGETSHRPTLHRFQCGLLHSRHLCILTQCFLVLAPLLSFCLQLYKSHLTLPLETSDLCFKWLPSCPLSFRRNSFLFSFRQERAS